MGSPLVADVSSVTRSRSDVARDDLSATRTDDAFRPCDPGAWGRAPNRSMGSRLILPMTGEGGFQNLLGRARPK